MGNHLTIPQLSTRISKIVHIIILEKDHNPKLQVEPCARKHHQKRHHKGEAPLIKNPSGVAKYVFENCSHVCLWTLLSTSSNCDWKKAHVLVCMHCGSMWFLYISLGFQTPNMRRYDWNPKTCLKTPFTSGGMTGRLGNIWANYYNS